MNAEVKIVCVSDDTTGQLLLLNEAERLHRSLRPDIPEPYSNYLQRTFDERAGMAMLVEGDAARAIAVYRCHHTTFHGKRFYIDDLVTDEGNRGRGFGGQLLAWCEARARTLGCDVLDLESGVQRPRSHKFYFAHDLSIFTFGFTETLQSSLNSPAR